MENSPPPPYPGLVKDSYLENTYQPNINNTYQPYNITTAFNAYSLPVSNANGYNPVYEGNHNCNYNPVVNPCQSTRIIHLTAINNGIIIF